MKLTAAAAAGATVLQTDYLACSVSVGSMLVLNSGAANSELVVVTGFGSLLLAAPLQFDHAVGEPVVPQIGGIAGQESSKQSLSTGAIAGIATGAAVVLFFAILAAVAYACSRKASPPPARTGPEGSVTVYRQEGWVSRARRSIRGSLVAVKLQQGFTPVPPPPPPAGTLRRHLFSTQELTKGVASTEYLTKGISPVNPADVSAGLTIPEGGFGTAVDPRGQQHRVARARVIRAPNEWLRHGRPTHSRRTCGRVVGQEGRGSAQFTQHTHGWDRKGNGEHEHLMRSTCMQGAS